MRTGGRRRADRSGYLAQALFGSAGWLFADLMVVIAMAFLVANTFGGVPPKSPAKVKPTPHPTATPTPTAAPTPVQALDLNYVCILLQVNPQTLIAGSASETASVRQQIMSNPQLTSRHAGLVLLFGGDSDYPLGVTQAKQMDSAVVGILNQLGNHNFVFYDTVYRNFLGLNDAPDTVELDVYLFKTAQTPSPAPSSPCPS
jgi:hypothetical protein